MKDTEKVPIHVTSGLTFTYCVLIASGFVALVVNMAMFFLQIKLNPVVQTHNLLPVLGLSDKHMLKTTGILPVYRE